MHVGKFGTYDNNSTHGFINRQDSCKPVTWGLGVLQPHMSLDTMEMYTKEVGKIEPKIITIAVLKERKIASSYHQSILDPPGYHHIEM